jgi:hypothetical protein
MDTVYHRSISTVGIITSQIITSQVIFQKHLDALDLIILNELPSERNSEPDPNSEGDARHNLMHNAHAILEILALDRWFTRAWTY